LTLPGPSCTARMYPRRLPRRRATSWITARNDQHWSSSCHQQLDDGAGRTRTAAAGRRPAVDGRVILTRSWSAVSSGLKSSELLHKSRDEHPRARPGSSSRQGSEHASDVLLAIIRQLTVRRRFHDHRHRGSLMVGCGVGRESARSPRRTLADPRSGDLLAFVEIVWITVPDAVSDSGGHGH